MSLLDKATIITTPTAHSNGVLHSIKGGSVADFDVVRGSAATRVNAEGLIEDVATNIPRIDYTGGGCPSLLLEPQSTNLVTHSEDFSDASWDKNATLIVTSNNAISPDGTQNATRVNKVSSGGRLGVDIPITSGQSYTLSFYMKNNGGNTSLEASFDGQSANQSYTITDNWERYEFTFIATTTKTSQIRLFQAAVNIDAHIWGAQLEALPYATSYIPTSGQIATRLADSVTGAGDATTFNSTEGVLYAEMSGTGTQGGLQTIGMFSGNVESRVLFRRNPTTNKVQALVYVNNIIQFNVQGNMLNGFNKVALKYKENDFALWLNGVEVGSSNSGLAPVASLSKLSFKDEAVGNPFFGKVKDVRTYNTALTDAELTELTTI